MIRTRFHESANLLRIMLCEYHQNQDMQGYILYRKHMHLCSRHACFVSVHYQRYTVCSVIVHSLFVLFNFIHVIDKCLGYITSMPGCFEIASELRLVIK